MAMPHQRRLMILTLQRQTPVQRCIVDQPCRGCGDLRQTGQTDKQLPAQTGSRLDARPCFAATTTAGLIVCCLNKSRACMRVKPVVNGLARLLLRMTVSGVVDVQHRVRFVGRGCAWWLEGPHAQPAGRFRRHPPGRALRQSADAAA